MSQRVTITEWEWVLQKSSNTLSEDGDAFQYINSFRQLNIEQDIFLYIFIEWECFLDSS